MPEGIRKFFFTPTDYNRKKEVSDRPVLRFYSITLKLPKTNGGLQVHAYSRYRLPLLSPYFCLDNTPFSKTFAGTASPTVGTDSQLQNRLFLSTHYPSYSLSPIILLTVVHCNTKTFLLLLIRNGIRFHSELVSLRLYFHPIITNPATSVPILK